MTRMLLANVATETTDEEIGEFLVKYGFPAYSAIERVPGDGSRPAVMISFDEIDGAALDRLKSRIHEIYWKKRKISVRVLLDDFR